MRVAADAHASQFRKGTVIPYFTHLAGTAIILARGGFCDEELLAAAFLHDSLEDTELTDGEIKREFGKRVASLVRDASEVKRDAHGQTLPWKTRKSEHLSRLASCSVESRAIVLADKLHNLGTLIDDLKTDPGAWTRFNASPADTIGYYEAMFRLADDEPSLQSFAASGSEMLSALRTHPPCGPENREH